MTECGIFLPKNSFAVRSSGDLSFELRNYSFANGEGAFGKMK